MPLYKNKIGPDKASQLYVWSQKRNGPSKTNAIISAHGGIANINGMGEAAQCRLIFYVPHGYWLNDPGLENIIAGKVLPCGDPLSSHDSQDYELCKYTNTRQGQTKHNQVDESYDLIAGLGERFGQMHKEHLANVVMLTDEMVNGNATFLRNRKEQQTLARLYSELPMDVITIRARFWIRVPDLSWVLEELWKYEYVYDEIHCNFCRGGLKDDDPNSLENRNSPKKVDLAAS